MKIDKNPKKPIVYYVIVSLIVVLLLNTFIFPIIQQQRITQVDYGTFLTQIEDGKIGTVEIQENQIAYTIPSEGGKDRIYVTGRMDDPDLVNRLYEAKVEFTKVVPKEVSTIMSFCSLGFSH